MLDTHVWLWLLTRPDQLSETVRIAIESASELWLSAISPFEVALKYSTGKLDLDLSAREWIPAALSYPGLELAPLTPEVSMLAVELRPSVSKDPADCIIAATALTRGMRLVTRDRRLHAALPDDVLW
jgi:PIN domain nuclease of toxin-antitoxin system